MFYALKINIAKKANYGGFRKLTDVKYIVLHYTGNDGDHDESNANYFKNNVVKASAHYFVDDDSVTNSVPEDCVAWSVGGSKYQNCKTTGGGSYYGKCTNANSISIELCDTVKDGKVYPSEKTIANAIELVQNIMKRFGIPASNVIRHFDVTGKACPAYWCGSSAKNNLWLTTFKNKLSGTSQTAQTATETVEYYKIYTGASGSLVAALNALKIDSSYSNRKKIASANGISGYSGTAAQNTLLLNILKSGKLKKA